MAQRTRFSVGSFGAGGDLLVGRSFSVVKARVYRQPLRDDGVPVGATFTFRAARSAEVELAAGRYVLVFNLEPDMPAATAPDKVRVQIEAILTDGDARVLREGEFTRGEVRGGVPVPSDHLTLPFEVL